MRIMVLPKFWFIQPLHTSIVEILVKKGGVLTDTELYNALERKHSPISFREFNKTLMRLEVEGIIHVSNLTKNRKSIELIKI